MGSVTQSFDVFEAKDHLTALLDEVEAGHEILITQHGKPVARLVLPMLASTVPGRGGPPMACCKPARACRSAGRRSRNWSTKGDGKQRYAA